MSVVGSARAAFVAIVLLAAAPAAAQTMTLPFDVPAKLSGVDVTFPVRATLTQAASDQPVGLVAKVDLEDVRAKVDAVIRAAGLHQPPGNYQSFDYKGTLLEARDGRLWAKYHFRVDLKRLPATNGSVEMFVRPVAEAEGLRFVGENAQLNVSNEIVRGVVSAMKLEQRLATEGLAAVNGFLASPEARLKLPKELAAMNGTLSSARFASEEGRLLLVAEGALGGASAGR